METRGQGRPYAARPEVGAAGACLQDGQVLQEPDGQCLVAPVALRNQGHLRDSVRNALCPLRRLLLVRAHEPALDTAGQHVGPAAAARGLRRRSGVCQVTLLVLCPVWLRVHQHLPDQLARGSVHQHHVVDVAPYDCMCLQLVHRLGTAAPGRERRAGDARDAAPHLPEAAPDPHGLGQQSDPVPPHELWEGDGTAPHARHCALEQPAGRPLDGAAHTGLFTDTAGAPCFRLPRRGRAGGGLPLRDRGAALHPRADRLRQGRRGRAHALRRGRRLALRRQLASCAEHRTTGLRGRSADLRGCIVATLETRRLAHRTYLL
mmetsp:Transcript_120443/g.341249  ORF Transcript_120443/g.341249 Transcript_120443/m.341249 type:complete len:319 (+) Transcript_120443:319-1275(+)